MCGEPISMEDGVIIGIVVFLVVGISLYLYRSKKRGETCIGCPYCKKCAGKGSCGNCGGKEEKKHTG